MTEVEELEMRLETLQYRADDLLKFYGGKHDQKTHGRKKKGFDAKKAALAKADPTNKVGGLFGLGRKITAKLPELLFRVNNSIKEMIKDETELHKKERLRNILGALSKLRTGMEGINPPFGK